MIMKDGICKVQIAKFWKLFLPPKFRLCLLMSAHPVSSPIPARLRLRAHTFLFTCACVSDGMRSG